MIHLTLNTGRSRVSPQEEVSAEEELEKFDAEHPEVRREIERRAAESTARAVWH